MPSLNSTLIAPLTLAWCNRTSASGSAVTSNKISVYPDGHSSLGILTPTVAFSSQYSVFQARWRMRRRYIPSIASAMDPTGADVWTQFGSWQGSDESSVTAFSTFTIFGSTRAFNPSVTLSYELGSSDYDLIEYEFQVRVLNTTTGECSEWCSDTLQICYVPSIEVNGTLLADGSMDLEIACENSSRDIYLSVVNFISAGEVYGRRVYLTSVLSNGVVSTLNIAAEYVRSSMSLQCTVKMDTLEYDVIPIVIAPHVPGVIVEPEIHFEDTPIYTSISVTGTYDNVSIVATWDDCEGNEHFEMLDAAEFSDEEHIARLVAPPLNTPIHFRVACTHENTWKAWTYAHVVSSKSIIVSDDDGITFDFGAAAKYQISPNVSIVDMADGSSRSNYGIGAAKKITMDAFIIKYQSNPWVSELAKLYSSHDWWFRTPIGDRFRIAITSVVVDEFVNSPRMAVALSAKEVAQ